MMVLLLAAGPLFSQADLLNARVERLEIKNSNQFLTVSFKVSGTFTREIKEKIHSGIETAFEHVIKIYKKNPILPMGRVLLEHAIVTTVKYDTLTKLYTLQKKVNGQSFDTATTDRLEEVEEWMTEISDFKVGSIDPIKGKKNYFLKVRTSIAPNFLLFFIPYDYSASKEKELRF
ncbi:MAG: DUF4390 domain-containing protein [Acidobacteriota bacterium]